MAIFTQRSERKRDLFSDFEMSRKFLIIVGLLILVAITGATWLRHRATTDKLIVEAIFATLEGEPVTVDFDKKALIVIDEHGQEISRQELPTLAEVIRTGKHVEIRFESIGKIEKLRQPVPSSQSAEFAVHCRYVRNYDGDTVTVDISGWHPIVGDDVPIRIAGIDTPEIRGTRGQVKQMAFAAKQLTGDLCRVAKKLELRNLKRGKYRLVADVYADGVNVSDRLLQAGLAKPYDGGTRPDWGEPNRATD